MGNQATHSQQILSDKALVTSILNAGAYNHQSSPAQQVITFDEWIFDSSFDSGNIQKVEQVGPTEFNVWVAHDNFKTEHESKKRFWFYFQVVPRKPIQEGKERVVTFNIKNMAKMQHRQYSDGMVPVYKSIPHSDTWKYIPTKLTKYSLGKYNIELSFEYKFTSADQRVYLAYSFPYSYTDAIKFVDSIDRLYTDDKDIYFHRELLTLTKELRRIDLLTITAKGPKFEESIAKYPTERVLENLFPLVQSEIKDLSVLHMMNPKLLKRPPIFPKQYIFITARVHAAEAPGSMMFESFVKRLLDKSDEVSRRLLEKFVFILIPVLNPDGVARGNSRYDLFARDPNDIFDNPKFETEPPQYAVIELAKELGKNQRLWMFLDMHAHCNHDGAFVFGTLGKDKQQKLDTRTFIRVLDCYSKHFDFEASTWNACNFEAPNGVAKNAVMFHSNCHHSYTLEASYHKGIKDAERYVRFTVEDLKKRWDIRNQLKKAEAEGIDCKVADDDLLEKYFPKIQYRLVPEHFEEVGDALRHAILEVVGDHPNSKLKDTCFGNLKNLIQFQQSLPIISLTKKGAKKKSSKKGSKTSSKKTEEHKEGSGDEESDDDVDNDEEEQEENPPSSKKDRDEL